MKLSCSYDSVRFVLVEPELHRVTAPAPAPKMRLLAAPAPQHWQ
jgi:hypothetical protein